MKNEWIVNDGEMPVAAGVLVDVQHRDGEEVIKATAGQGKAEDWTLDDDDHQHGDILMWRLNKG